MSRQATKDMTQGAPMRLIIGFLLPVWGGFLFQQFYNLMDSMIVGRFLGVTSLAAVGETTSINFMILGFCIGICNGFAIPIAQAFGAKDMHRLRQYVYNAIILTAVIAVLMTVIVCSSLYSVLELMGAPADIIGEAYRYCLVLFLGTCAAYLYNMASSIMRALGDSRTPLYFLIFSSVLNIILDLVAVILLHMGVEGAALATDISQAVSGILCVFYMRKRFEVLHLQPEDKKPLKEYMMTLTGMGIPMGLQYMVTGIGSVILQASVNTLGSLSVAAMASATKIHAFLASSAYDAMGSTMATYTGQNAGAKEIDRIPKGLKDCLIIGFGYAAAVLVFVIFAGRSLALLFVDSTQTSVIEEIYMFLVVYAASYWLLALVNICRFSIQGMGFSKIALIAGIMELIARTITAVFLVPSLGFLGACLASPLAWILANAFLIPTFILTVRKLKKMA